MKCISINQYHPCIAKIIRTFLQKWLKFVSYSDIFWFPKRSCSDQGEAERVEVDPPALLDLLYSSFERPNRLLSILNIWFWFDSCWAVTDVKISLSLPLTSHQSMWVRKRSYIGRSFMFNAAYKYSNFGREQAIHKKNLMHSFLNQPFGPEHHLAIWIYMMWRSTGL